MHMESAEHNPQNVPQNPAAELMSDEIDWNRATFEGNRPRQMQEFAALPFRERLERVEQLNALVEWFRRKDREKRPKPARSL